MSSKSDKPADTDQPRNDDGAIQLILSMADTTWRMFTPPAILVPIGIFADLELGTKPWITLACVPVGLVLSALLIKQQLKKGR
jgi:hypothetical protein